MKKILATTVLALGLPALTLAGPGDWALLGSVDGPALGNGDLGTIRIGADSNAQVYVSVNNSTVRGVYSSTDFVSAVTASPMVAPTWTLVHDNALQENGFQGIATDSSDDVFFVGDENGNPGEVVKYTDAGVAVAAFGTAGVVEPSVRLTGADVMSDGSLLSTTFGGVLHQFDGTTGAESATTADTLLDNYCRDIAIKQDSGSGNDVIFINWNGDLKMVTGGSAADISGYTTVVDFGTGITNSDTSWDVKAGVDYFAAEDTVIYTNHADQKGYVVDGTTGALLQEIDLTQTPSIGVSDVVAFQAGGNDYLVFVFGGVAGVTVYSKASTVVSSVQDWMMF